MARLDAAGIDVVVQDLPDAPESAANRARELVRAHARKAGVPVLADIDSAVTAAIEAIRRR